MPRNQGSQETSAFVGHPEHGVTNGSDIDPAELEPHYFTPNFLRPMPEAEDDPELDSESLYDVSNDVRPACDFTICIGTLPDSWNAAGAILGLKFGFRSIQLPGNEEVPKQSNQAHAQSARV